MRTSRRPGTSTVINAGPSSTARSRLPTRHYRTRDGNTTPSRETARWRAGCASSTGRRPPRSGRALASAAPHLGQHLSRLRVPNSALVGTRPRDPLQRRIRSNPRGQAPCSAGPSGAPTSGSEIWDVIGPMLSHVYEHAEATRSRDLLLHIDRGYVEEAYFSFSLQPDSLGWREGRRDFLSGHRNDRKGRSANGDFGLCVTWRPGARAPPVKTRSMPRPPRFSPPILTTSPSR